MPTTPRLCLLGAIAGDVIGSAYEYHPTQRMDFELFPPNAAVTDDSILTLAVADALMNQRPYADCLLEYARKYPHPMGEYGAGFSAWVHGHDHAPYNSFGNGSAMRVSPVAWAYDTDAEVLQAAEASAAVTHNHPEGIKGAQAVALAILHARQGASKDDIRRATTQRFGYDLSQTVDQIRPSYRFYDTCQMTVPQAFAAFLDSADFEDAIRKAVSLGGDADTLAAITGSIAEAFYGGVPQDLLDNLLLRIPPELWSVIESFNLAYPWNWKRDMKP